MYRRSASGAHCRDGLTLRYGAGRLVAEIPCDETGRADWDREIDFDRIKAN